MTPRGFLFALERCTGCAACQLACSIENELGTETSWRRVESYGRAHAKDRATFHLSLACHHCAQPACMQHCPALAYRKDEATGAVLIDEERCIGCGYCAWACPYDAPQLDRERGVMTKCTFCNERLHEALQPACVQGCPTGALGTEARADASRDALGFVPPAFPRTTIGPSLRFVAPSPELHSQLAIATHASRVTFTLRHEWPLFVFSVLVTILVAWFAGSPLTTTVDRLAFASLAGLALIVSTVHLGRPSHAWRAVLNVRGSWLSREIALVSAFLGLAVFVPVVSTELRYGTAGLGFVALFAIDRVYDVLPSARGGNLHSADTLLAGALLASVFAGSAVIAAVLAVISAALYVQRHGSRTWIRSSWMVLRLLSLASVVLLFTPWPAWASMTLVGFALDRAEFYRASSRH